MFYGGFVKDNTLFRVQLLSRINADFLSADIQHHEVSYGCFKGGVFLNNKLPYSKKDFVFIDYQREVIVLLSGTIYNVEDFSFKQCITPVSHPTPELIIEAYLKYGENFVEDLNGDFAIFIYDKKLDKAFLYRDHLGVRPVSYAVIKSSFFFHSDGYSLSKAILGSDKIDDDYLKLLFVKYGLSYSLLVGDLGLLPNKNVKKLLPGHYLSVQGSCIEIKKYWKPEKIKEACEITFTDAVMEIKKILRSSVRQRADQRFSASVHLSGGLDSSVIASLARHEYKSKKVFYGYCWSPLEVNIGGRLKDERNLVNELALVLNIKPIFSNAICDDYIKYLSNWRNFTDLFYEEGVLNHAASNGVNLILSGWGGDEFISSGEIGVDTDLFFSFQWRALLKRHPLKRPDNLLRLILNGIILPALSLRFYFSSMKGKRHIRYLKKGYTINGKTLNDFYSWKSRREMLLKFLYQYHLAERAENWYLNGFKMGVEYRYPLIDKRIVEFILKIPSKVLTNGLGNRQIMREIARETLPEVIWKNNSKNDPSRITHLNVIMDEACRKIAGEIRTFENDPLLGMIDFRILKESLNSFSSGKNKRKYFEEFSILFFMKKAHEFAKEYHRD